MDELRHKPRGPMTLLMASRRVRRWGVVAAVFAVLYLVSIGPAFVLSRRISRRPGPDLEWPNTVFHVAYGLPLERPLQFTRSAWIAVAYIEWCDSVAMRLLPPKPIVPAASAPVSIHKSSAERPYSETARQNDAPSEMPSRKR